MAGRQAPRPPGYGSIGKWPGSAERPQVMPAGRLDKVGFVVRLITDNTVAGLKQ